MHGATRRRRQSSAPTAILDPRFEGTRYSSEECLFLIEHFGKPSIVAIPPELEELPVGVNEAEVTRILDRTYQLELYQQSLRDSSGDDTVQVWVGFDKLKAVLEETLLMRAEVAELKRRTRGARAELRAAACAPSLYLWDPSTDQAYRGGVGSDSDIVVTRLNEDGSRTELFTELSQTGEGSISSLAGVAKFIKSKTRAEQSGKILTETPDDFEYDEGEHHAAVICPLCKKSEAYQPGKPSTKRAAVAKMVHHLDSEKVIKVDQHRILSQRVKSGKTNRKQVGETTSRATKVKAGSRKMFGRSAEDAETVDA